ncbi:hypothetical protein CEXT_550331 [Caerostris extrusa]|uniref:Uncharacterized protein n=1 Tax=Caerostris extrusa TaxID=172846 RepID=A0AAV4N5E7_CAEEX|nr:hypothetical protein CEXT_550331 [Caerostris extrusa]
MDDSIVGNIVRTILFVWLQLMGRFLIYFFHVVKTMFSMTLFIRENKKKYRTKESQVRKGPCCFKLRTDELRCMSGCIVMVKKLVPVLFKSSLFHCTLLRRLLRTSK